MVKQCEKYELAINLTEASKKIVFSLLGVIAVINSSCASMYQVEASTAASSIDSPPSMPTEPTPPVNTISQDVKLTPSELQEFDSIMLELDPDQQLVTKITQQKLSNTVNVTIGPGFMTLSQDRKYEIAVAMRTGLSQVCLCSPYLKFNSEDGQPLVEIDQYLEWQ